MTERIWTDQDFEKMSWHDNHVHGLRIVEGEYGAGELMLDLDHIIEWCNCEDGCKFRILPVTLTFRGVTSLQLSLDYKTPTAGLCPFSIASIEREHQERDCYVAKIWRILINWPNGTIEFEAEGFVQRGVGESVLSEGQYLNPQQRNHRV